MFEFFEMLVIGFTISLSGALMPGPMLFATIETSLKNGWTSGPKVVVGHAVLEVFLFLLIVFGMTSIVGDGVISAISIVGGAVLIIFGVMTLRDAKGAYASLDNHDGMSSNAFVSGFITSVTNPYFWIWWLAVGSAFLFQGLETGILVAAAFLLGNWLADLVWFSIVAASFSRGKTLMSASTYERILMACGLFLLVFGAWFVLG